MKFPRLLPGSLVLLFIVMLAMPSCSVKKNTVISRMYHKTTAHYNGFFNARERVKTGAKTLAASHIDRYDRILSVFKFGDPALAKAVFPDMDEAIKKVSLVIQRHSMEIDGKERNKWIDDSYLLIGVAQFYKHETWTAIESFQFVAAQYRSEPIRYDALLWLTQCYLMLGKMPDADYLLATLRDDPNLPEKLKSRFNAIYADYYINQNDYENAVIHLEKATAMAKKRPDRIRYAFILGQIYQKTGELPKAVTKYDQVLKMNPPYEMAFNAKVNRAQSVDVNAAGGEEITRMLEKMLTDEKNIEYLDQIYYALANIALKKDSVQKAIDFLQLSVNSSTTNANQKALSYLKLAEIYFKKPEYKLAQSYYDSTVSFLTQDYPDYISILNTKNNLTKLIKNLNVIQTEDSLQRLASKSSAERESIVNSIIEEESEVKRKAEQDKRDRIQAEKEANEAAVGDPFMSTDIKPATTQPSSGGWYFSNPSAISFGFNEFVRLWGNRKLEDNWRRSSRATFAENQLPEDELAEGDSTEMLDQATRDSIMALDNDKKKQAYLSAIPLTPEQKAKSDEKIVEAYYNVGLIYKEQLRDNKESGRNFETLLQRYPENQYRIPTIYNLYRVYLALGDQEKSDYYKNLILNDYPDTEYAKIILNPDYFKDQQKKVAIQKIFYENTYRAYLNKQYEDVIQRKAMADSLFPQSDLTPKFDFLKTLAIGRTRPIPEFEASLKSVVVKYPDDSVTIRAKEILALINPGTVSPAMLNDTAMQDPGAPNVIEPQAPKTAFIRNDTSTQYIIFVYANNTISTDELKVALSNYHTKFYSIKNLQVTSAFLGSNTQFVMIKEFGGREDALKYLDGLLSDPEAFADVDISTATPVAITPDNLILLLQTQDINGYQQFYEESYLN